MLFGRMSKPPLARDVPKLAEDQVASLDQRGQNLGLFLGGLLHLGLHLAQDAQEIPAFGGSAPFVSVDALLDTCTR